MQGTRDQARADRAGSGDQLLAALGTTTGQNLAAVRGSHARTKTVGTSATDFAGLIGAFHGSVTEKRSQRLSRTRRSVKPDMKISTGPRCGISSLSPSSFRSDRQAGAWIRRCGLAAHERWKASSLKLNTTPGCVHCRRSRAMARSNCWHPILSWSTGSPNTCYRVSANGCVSMRALRPLSSRCKSAPSRKLRPPWSQRPIRPRPRVRRDWWWVGDLTRIRPSIPSSSVRVISSPRPLPNKLVKIRARRTTHCLSTAVSDSARLT